MRKRTIGACAAFLLCTAAVSAGPALEEHAAFEGFESGSVGSWSSYPPAQDTAYDPTIWVKPLAVEKDVENRALYREITPNYPIEYVFGVREKFDLWVDGESTLSFRAYVKSASGVDGIRARFAFSDGASAETTVTYTETETWTTCLIPFSSVLAGDGRRKLTAVAFMAVVPQADPESLLRFGLDDVRIDGWRERRFRFTEPAVHGLDEWEDRIAGRYYREGESLTIAGEPPLETKSVTVTIARALTGGDEKTFTIKAKRGRPFSLDLPLDGKKGPDAGFWRATLAGESADGETFTTSLVFLVMRADAPTGHPRLFFSAGDVDGIMSRASHGHLRTVRDRLEKHAAGLRGRYDPDDFDYNLDAYDEVYWLPTFGGYYSAIWTPNGYIRENAFVHALSGDPEAAEAAKRGLMSMTEWPSLLHPHIRNQGQFSYWPVGIMFTDLALSYDLLHGSMSPDERRKAADFLFEKGVTQVFNEYVRDNRVSSNTSNWISDAMGAGILGCAAIMDEYEPEELEPYLSGCILKVAKLIEETFDADGAYGEGALYYSHALHCLTKTMPVLERIFGVRFPEEKIARSHLFLVYQTDAESGRIYDYGDAFENVRLFRDDGYLGFGNFSWLIRAYRDPHLAWYYRLNPGATGRDLVFFDETVAPEPPDDLPKTAHFSDAGTVVFRSGFSHDDFVFVFRCGPFYNHHHFDQGSFFLSDRGEEFLTESGRTDYYTDPWYQKLYIQAGGHNCVLVDGNPESQKAGDFLHDVPAWRDYARITDFLRFDGGAFVSGRLEKLYKGKLEYLSRSVLFVEPRTVVLIDEAVPASGTREVNLRFHAQHKDEIAVDGSSASFMKPGGALAVRTLAPPDCRAEVLKRPMTLNEFKGDDAITMRARGFLQLTARLPERGATVVNVMSTDGAVMGGLNERSLDGYTVVDIAGREYAVKTTPRGSFVYDGMRTDALVLSGYGDGGYFAGCATVLTVAGEPVFRSDRPVSVTVKTGDTTTVAYSAREKTRLVLSRMDKPRLVTLDGERFGNWRFDRRDGLALDLDAGTGAIEIR